MILAMTPSGGISKQGKLPWSKTDEGKMDMKFFKKVTSNNAIIYGYNTYISFGLQPLPSRINILVTESHYFELHDKQNENFYVCNTLDSAVNLGYKLERELNIKCFITGGASIYNQYVEYYNPTAIYYSIINWNTPCDTSVNQKVIDMCPTEGIGQIIHYTNLEEEKYLELFRDTLNYGHVKQDRTGTGTISQFSPPNLHFSLCDNKLPVLTTKRVALKTSVIPELLWFISGSTDTRILEQQGCNIWKGNTSVDFLSSRDLPYDEGDLGPGYGFQWRHSGAEYHGMNYNYDGKGIDQLQNLIDELYANPDSRRLIMTAWVPEFIEQMALPPCHMTYQLYSHKHQGKRYLSAKMYQRSADSFLGVPFNITSYAILTHIIAAIVGMEASELIITYGDYHIYQNHIKQVQEQLNRKPTQFPKIHFKRDLKNTNINDVCIDDIIITGYNPHGKIAAPMAV